MANHARRPRTTPKQQPVNPMQQQYEELMGRMNQLKVECFDLNEMIGKHQQDIQERRAEMQKITPALRAMQQQLGGGQVPQPPVTVEVVGDDDGQVEDAPEPTPAAVAKAATKIVKKAPAVKKAAT